MFFLFDDCIFMCLYFPLFSNLISLLIFWDPTQDLEFIFIVDSALIDTLDLIEKDHPIVIDFTLISLIDLFLRNPIIESKTRIINDVLAKTLKEVNNHDIFAMLNKVVGGDSTSTISPTKTLSIESGTKEINIPAIKILLECYGIIDDKDLKPLGTNKDALGKLIDKLTKLDPI